MTPEQENAIRAQGRKCVDEIRQAMKARPKPKWNSVVPPILKNITRRLRLWASALWHLSAASAG